MGGCTPHHRQRQRRPPACPTSHIGVWAPCTLAACPGHAMVACTPVAPALRAGLQVGSGVARAVRLGRGLQATILALPLPLHLPLPGHSPRSGPDPGSALGSRGYSSPTPW